MVRFEDLTGVTMKMDVFWDVTQCRLVDRYSVSEGPVPSIHFKDGDRRLLRKVNNNLPNYTALHPRKH
jgi:hypothetical protein